MRSSATFQSVVKPDADFGPAETSHDTPASNFHDTMRRRLDKASLDATAAGSENRFGDFESRIRWGVIPGRRESGEPGIHSRWPRVMDSGLATFGGAPE
jgi:hypothetical protein